MANTFKKFLALVLVLSLVMGMTGMAYAADDTTEDAIEDVIDTPVAEDEIIEDEPLPVDNTTEAGTIPTEDGDELETSVVTDEVAAEVAEQPSSIDWTAQEITITTAEQLKEFAAKVNAGNTFEGKIVTLGADIDLDNEAWTPIGTNSTPFKGTFDGDKKTISNLTATSSGSYVGLFGYIGGNAESGKLPEVKNLTVNNATVKSPNGNAVGGVVGNAFVAKVTNVHVTGTVDIEGSKWVGGVVGYGYVKIDGCSLEADGNIKGNVWCVGGILGYGGEGTTSVDNCSVEGTENGLEIYSTYCALGGVVGQTAVNGTQHVSGSNLTVKNVTMDSDIEWENTNPGYFFGGSNSHELTGVLAAENVTVEVAGKPAVIHDVVASVDGNCYTTLQEAIDAADEGQTVTLLRNSEPALTVDKSVILDLNNHKIGSSSVSYGIRVKKGTVKIQNGSVEGKSYGVYIADTNSQGKSAATDANVTLSNVKVVATDETNYAPNAQGKYVFTQKAYGVYAYYGSTNKNAEITIDNCVVSGAYTGLTVGDYNTVTMNNSAINSKYYGVTVWGQKGINGDQTPPATTFEMTGGSVTVKDGTVNGVGIGGNGGYHGSVITLNGVTVESSGAGIYHPQLGSLSVTGGSITGATGIQLCAGDANVTNAAPNGTITIKDAVIAATGADTRSAKVGDGFIQDGAAISVVDRNYPGGTPSITIEGGMFSSTNSKAVLAYTWDSKAADKIVEWDNAKENVTITGGTFTNNVETDGYVADGYTARYNGISEGTWTVVPNYVARVGANDYMTIAEAIAVNGGNNQPFTVTLLRSTSETVVIPADKTVTLDIPEGITLTNHDSNNGGSWGNTTIQNHGTLTITGGGTILSEMRNNHVLKNFEGATANLNGCTFKTTVNDYVLWNLGAMTIDGATVDNTDPVNRDNTVVYNGWRDGEFDTNRTDYNALLTIKSGIITSNSTTKNAVLNNDWATLVIEGGEIKAPRCIGNADIVEIKGGTFTVTTDGGRIALASGGSTDYNRGQLTITGGTFLTETTAETTNVIVNSSSAGESRETAISGGVFFKDVTEYCITNYRSTQRADGMWIVSRIPTTPVTPPTPSTPDEPDEPVVDIEDDPTALGDRPFIFEDVHEQDWFYDDVKNIFEQNLINGTTTTTYEPQTELTRGMIVTILWRIAGEPTVETTSTFADVPENAYYFNAINWGAANNIARGYDEETFAPDRLVSREELAAFIYRYSELIELDLTGIDEEAFAEFGDAESVLPWFVENMKWAISAGIVKGEDGMLLPQDRATRAEAAAMVNRFIQMPEVAAIMQANAEAETATDAE